MLLIDEVIKKIEKSGSRTLANGLASACNTFYGVSLLEGSSGLDMSNKKLIIRLLFICQEPDYSNASQDRALKWLREHNFIDIEDH
ncbi:MAG: hypothetical protein HRU23_08145 [Gammaproteobacteria bacterium]|nr:hypothetical protein [Gammaproteobacteria bacterium]